MTAHTEALLFLLQEAHATRYHPEDAAQRHIDAVTAEAEDHNSYQTRPSRIDPDHADLPPASDRSEPGYVKLYVCGCKAGPGPKDLPDYCPDHGNANDTLNTEQFRVY